MSDLPSVSSPFMDFKIAVVLWMQSLMPKRGLLPPALTTAQRDAITSPPAGLMIYNSTTRKINFYNGSAWEIVGTGADV